MRSNSAGSALTPFLTGYSVHVVDAFLDKLRGTDVLAMEH
jgi:hypothetical protein